jgi:hypothetical protein
MKYVDTGYAAALAGLFAYGLGLVLRRRRWERALKASRTAEGADVVAPGGRP